MHKPNSPLRNSFETSRTYPAGAEQVRRALEAAVDGLPRWRAGRSFGDEATSIRRTWLGFEDDVTVSLDEKRTGAHNNTRAVFRSVSRKGAYDFGQNKRNLRELLVAVDRELRGPPPR